MIRTRKRIAVLALTMGLVLFGVTYGLTFPQTALAWDDCPKGLVNDPYPGACSRYVDTNGDDICDLSQSEPVATTTTAAPPTTTTTTTTKVASVTTSTAAVTTTAGEPPTGDCPLGPCANCGACLSIGATDAAVVAEYTVDDSTGAAAAAGTVLLASTGDANTTTTLPPTGGSGADTATDATASGATSTDEGGFSLFTGYNISPIAIAFFLIYAVSFALYKTKRIRMATHRKIWNVLLLGTFLITGVFGLILTIQLDYTLPFRIPIDLLFWHVEAGVVMTLISLFHVGWHFNYYRCLLKRGRKKARAARAAERAQRGGVTAEPQVAVYARAPQTEAPTCEAVLEPPVYCAEPDTKQTERERRRALREHRRLERERRSSAVLPHGLPRRGLEPET